MRIARPAVGHTGDEDCASPDRRFHERPLGLPIGLPLPGLEDRSTPTQRSTPSWLGVQTPVERVDDVGLGGMRHRGS
jgi:hypothetical protein